MSVIEDIFVHPKTCYKFKNKSVDDSTLHELYELTKWGATSFNSSPMRLKFLKSTEAKQRLSKLVSDDNVQKVIDAQHLKVFGVSREERRKKRQALEGRQEGASDWSVYDLPPAMRSS